MKNKLHLSNNLFEKWNILKEIEKILLNNDNYIIVIKVVNYMNSIKIDRKRQKKKKRKKETER